MPTSTPTRARRPKPAVVKAVTAAEPDVLDDDERPAPIELTVTFDRDGDDEEHTFLARPRLTYKRMREAANAQAKGGVEAVLRFEKMIRPSLVDDDGTPAKWTPDAAVEGKFVDWNGDERDVADLAGLLEFVAGSSRRRWHHLMDVDDDVEITFSSILAAYEKLIENAETDRPTRRS